MFAVYLRSAKKKIRRNQKPPENYWIKIPQTITITTLRTCVSLVTFCDIRMHKDDSM